jgi:hypothetical protein
MKILSLLLRIITDLSPCFINKEIKKAWKLLIQISDPEVFAFKGLPKLPIRGDNAPRGGGSPVAGCDPEWERLPDQHGVALPVLAPIVRHCHPVCVWPLHAGTHYVPRTRHIGHQNQVEVQEPVDRESHSARFFAWYPASACSKSGAIYTFDMSLAN